MACTEWPMTCWTPPEDPAIAAMVWEGACDAVWALTGRRVGQCTYEAYYGLQPGVGGACMPSPLLYRGRWYNIVGSLTDCCRLRLDPGPVVSVEEVTVHGAPTTAYVRAGSELISTAGCWPTEVWCGLPPVHVSWTAGLAPPPVALFAAAELADELVKACAGDSSCRLPANVIAVTRQGVTVQLGDPTLLLEQGMTGLPRVDMAIRTLNPAKLVAPSAILSPDAPRRVLG